MSRLATRKDTLILTLVAALVGGIIGAALVSTSPADAMNGDYLVMGTKNSARNSTKIISPNSTQFINTKPGRPALTLNVQGGAAPMAVNSGTKVTNLNADFLDGFSGENLRIIGTYCSNDNSPDGVDHFCANTITLPRAGTIVMSGSTELFNTSAITDDFVTCRFKVDGVAIAHSDRDLDIGSDYTSDNVICATNAWIQLSAGTYEVRYTVEGVAATTAVGASSMTAIFIPG